MSKYISITRRKIDYFVIFLIFLMDCNFCYLISPLQALSRIWGTYAKALLVIISFIYFLLTKSWRVNNKFLRAYLFFYSTSFLFVSIMSKFTYSNERMINHFLFYCGPFLIILAWPLILFFKKEGGYEVFFRTLNIFMFIIYTLFILQWLISFVNGPFLLKVPYVNTRGGLLRMGLNGLENFMLVYNLCKAYTTDTKRKYIHIYMSIVGMLVMIFIEQTRAYEISFFVIISLLVLVKSDKTSKQKLLVVFLVGLCIVMFSTGLFSSFLNSFTEGKEVQSTLVRLNAYSYFWETFKANPLWGHGFITSTVNRLIKTGPTGNYYYADTGIVGLMAQMGVLGVISIVWPIIHWTRLCWKNRKKGIDIFLPLSIIYLITLMPTLICTQPVLVMVWPVYFAIFAYLESESDLDTEAKSLIFF